jgi:ubiquinone/menaquinone biosynthesis C-methylase UbiE
MGCGPAGSLEWADMAAERICLDPLAKYYQLLGVDAHKASYITSPSEQIPFPDGYFDVVSSFNSLDHVDDLNRTIAEIVRVTAQGGTFLLITDVNHEPTATEPIVYSWEIAGKFQPALTLLEEKHYEKSHPGIYESLANNIPFDHADFSFRPGVLTARFEKRGG